MLLFSLVFLLTTGPVASICKPVNRSPPVCYNNFDSNFYDGFREYLPIPRDVKNLQIYVPDLDDQRTAPGLNQCVEDSSFASGDTRDLDGKPFYFTWVSMDLKQPVFTIMQSNACALSKKGCPNQSGRGCASFQTCLITNVKQSTYTNSNLDRGHLVPNSALGTWYNTSASTFNMCNVGPQTSRLNQADWRMMESWIECLGTFKTFSVLAGPLFNSTKEAKEHCVCRGNVAGKLACSECDKGVAIPVPDAFWKLIVTNDFAVYPFIYDKSQYPCVDDMTNKQCGRGPVVQQIQQAFVGKKGYGKIAKLSGWQWPAYFRVQKTLDLLDQVEQCVRPHLQAKFEQEFSEQTF